MFSDKKMKAAGLFGKLYDRLEKVFRTEEGVFVDEYIEFKL